MDAKHPAIASWVMPTSFAARHKARSELFYPRYRHQRRDSSHEGHLRHVELLSALKCQSHSLAITAIFTPT